MSCKLSIIVPVYNVERYLNKCIDSILEQSFADFELILIDDGSPDRCGCICDEYAKEDRRIKVIHQVNGGLSNARNSGLDIAQGEYIGFVDSDDYIDKDMYELLYKFSQEYDADVVECGFIKVRGEEKELFVHDKDIMVGDNLFALEQLLKYWFHSITCNKIYKKYLFDGLRFPKGKIHEDEFIMYKIFLLLNKYVYIGAGKYFYVQREGSIMAQGYSVKRLDRLEAAEEKFNYLRENLKQKAIVNLAECEYFNEVLDNYQRLSINHELDPDRSYRRKLRQHIVKNYKGFVSNNKLKRYRHWIVLMKLSGRIFDMLYKLHLNLSICHYNFRQRCINFIRALLRKFHLDRI